MIHPARGEVWLVDLGLAAKVRPCLVVSIAPTDAERALVTLVAHTTSLRGTRFEATPRRARFLKPGAFDAQNLVTIPRAKLIRKLGDLDAEDFAAIETVVRLGLGIPSA